MKSPAPQLDRFEAVNRLQMAGFEVIDNGSLDGSAQIVVSYWGGRIVITSFDGLFDTDAITQACAKR